VKARPASRINRLFVAFIVTSRILVN